MRDLAFRVGPRDRWVRVLNNSLGKNVLKRGVPVPVSRISRAIEVFQRRGVGIPSHVDRGTLLNRCGDWHGYVMSTLWEL